VSLYGVAEENLRAVFAAIAEAEPVDFDEDATAELPDVVAELAAARESAHLHALALDHARRDLRAAEARIARLEDEVTALRAARAECIKEHS
jgi:hypothetical protein